MKNFDPGIFKAYDVRGIYPSQINEEVAYAMGQGYAEVIKPEGKVAVGHDIRIHSEELKKHLIRGLNDAGVDVVDIGLISTEMYYFAVGKYGYSGGIQVTASHNPPEWHGAKMVREKVIPISGESGLTEIRDFVISGKKINADKKGSVENKDILDDFCNFIIGIVDTASIKPLKIVYNPNFGFEGIVFKRVIELAKLPLTLIPLNAEPDGNFPKGRPDPYVPENRTEFVELVKKNKADFGVAWDADADRVFFCMDDGTFLEPYYSGTLIIKNLLGKFPGSKILYDPRNTWAMIEAAKENGGVALLERVGHSYIKARMRKEDAIFAVESSGHHYYRDFWYADSGMIPLMQIMETVSKEGKSLSELLTKVFIEHPISGEINYRTEKGQEILAKIEKKYSDATILKVDGLSVEDDDWRFNLRLSNTEPLLRLNVEARSKEKLQEKLKEVVEFIEANK